MDTPQQKFNPKDVLRLGRGDENKYLTLSVSSDEHRNNQMFVNDILRSTGAKTINLDDVLCEKNICPLVRNAKFLYSDDDHLSIEGSLLIEPTLSKNLKN